MIKSSTIPAVNSTLDSTSGADFTLLSTQYGGLVGVLFYYGQKDIALDVTANLFLIFRIPSTIDSMLAWYGQKKLSYCLLTRCT